MAVVQACIVVWRRTQNRRATAIGLLTLADLQYRTAMTINSTTATAAEKQNRSNWLQSAVSSVQECGLILVNDDKPPVPTSAKVTPVDDVRPAADAKSPGHRLRQDANVGIRADALHNLGVYRTEQAFYDDARRSFDAAADLYRTMPTTAGFSMTMVSMARMFRSRGIGHADDAENALNCAIEFAANTDDRKAPHHARPILERAVIRSEIYRDFETARWLCKQILNDFPRLDTSVRLAAEALLASEQKSAGIDIGIDEKQPIVNRHRRILFVIDRSGSMDGAKMATCKSCIQSFLDDHCAQTTDVGLISFSNDIRIDVNMQRRGPSTGDTALAIKRIVAGLQANGGTALFGAIQAGFNELQSVIKRNGAGIQDAFQDIGRRFAAQTAIRTA
jgi:hypothetical protein